MASLNIRNVPDELMRDLKRLAAAGGQTLRDYCLIRLETPPTPERSAPFSPLDIPGVKLGSDVFPGNMCTYTEFDGQTGETYGCSLTLGHRGPHKRGAKL
jgi:hypothetical protein